MFVRKVIRLPQPSSMLRSGASLVGASHKQAGIRPWRSTGDPASGLHAPPFVIGRQFSTPAVETASSDSEDFALDGQLRPNEVVAELDRHIVGQKDAKRAVAIAMRNRWRRMQLPEDVRKEVTPRNVLLVGPTGCGKTEVARRMAMINDAPFLKVEATKFTEVGYHGRDVEQIIRDLMDVSMQLTKRVWTEKLRAKASAMVEDKILDLLAGPASTSSKDDEEENDDNEKGSSSASRGRESFRDMLRQGILDDQTVEVNVPIGDKSGNEMPMSGDPSNPTFVAMSDLYQKLSGSGSKKQPTERKKLFIPEARKAIEQIELEKLLENVDLKKLAVEAVEQSGIVFIDEIDKICTPREGSSYRTADASAEGVQRDLLPLIEGTTIKTNYGNVNTDYILFVASGAFHAVKPSDLLPELQGRLPIRVHLKGLTEDDLYRILTEPVANLVRQQIEMIGTEGVTLEFEDEAIREIARMAALLNREIENIGARRLHTVMERIMEDLSFEASDKEKGTLLKVDQKLVEGRLEDVKKKTDHSRYIL
uniref:AAA+ ATPase domain-containing protein n=1 Tax=Entomoneis paludosa TaxID=265537 RepID=A0A7S2YCT9_9STRA|mmetsp:Transcript_26891/g.56316  ORF Transcript_26891/g.56316 Transcript_26891/m.56316 type:complete len:536 (+) Transcript_26891:205-1812(+)